MEVSINPVSGTSPHYTPPAVKAAAEPQGTQAQTAVPQAPAHSSPDTVPSSSADADAALLRQAALSFKNVYALGDQQFSIFKDATGKYITRYVSLRDGKVTYTPQPALVRQLQPSLPVSPSRITISA